MFDPTCSAAIRRHLAGHMIPAVAMQDTEGKSAKGRRSREEVQKRNKEVSLLIKPWLYAWMPCTMYTNATLMIHRVSLVCDAADTS